MRYINAIVKILTFPGGFLRGFWEQVLCKIYGVPVENKKYFQFNEMAGHVEHEPLPTASKSFWYCLTSGLLVFLAGIVFASFSVINLFYLDVANVVMRYLSIYCLYLGFSMLTNIFPSVEDALMMWEKYKSFGKAAKVLFAPGAAIMYAGSFLESWGITFLTNAALFAIVLFV